MGKRPARGAKRRQAEKRGRRAELLAVWWLRAKGYQVLETRFKRPVGEIDIIAKRGEVLAFVEVKQRKHLSAAATAVSFQAWQRIARTAEIWAAAHPRWQHLSWRYDLIALAPNRLPKHFRDYWRP